MMWQLCMCSDEIYANSIFKAAHFVSMASVLDQASPSLKTKGRSLVHTVFGLSKDWWVTSAHTENHTIWIAPSSPKCATAYSFNLSISNVFTDAKVPVSINKEYDACSGISGLCAG